MLKNKFILFLIILSAVSCAPKKQITVMPSGNYIIVIAEGIADIREAGLSEATDRAYLDAQHKAVENALGKLYSARTVVESGRFIEQRVLADVKGYIRKWKKIAGPEAQDFPGTKDKIVWVKIEAEVGLDKLKDDTLALEEIQIRLGRPDISVIVKNEHASQIIISKLKQKKFTVREPISLEEAALGGGHSAENIDLIIDGVVEARSAGEIMEGVKMKSYQSDVTLKAINVSDGEVIATSSEHGAYPHIEDETGKAGAIKKATERAMDILIEKMLKAWEDVLNNGNNLYLKVKGLSLDRESDFKRILHRYLRGVKEIHSKGFKNNIMTYKVMYLGNSQNMAKDLSLIKGDFKVVVNSYKMNIVEVELR